MHRYKYSFIILGIVAISLLVSYIFGDTLGFLDSREEITRFVDAFGPWGPVVLIALIVVEVLVAPLPGGILPVVAGILFGPLLGILYSWIGNVIGSIIAFSLARRFGVRIVRYFVRAFNKDLYQKDLHAHQGMFWVSYAIPLVPVDILSFAFGISSISFRKFTVAITIGFLIRMAIWNIFGNSIAKIVFIS